MQATGPLRVLLVEDSAGDALLIQEHLASAGIRDVVHVETGEEALAALGGARADVVLLDYGLPGMSGPQVLEALRGRFPQIPVVMLTAREDHRAARETLRAGAADFVSKGDMADASFRAGISAILRRLADERAHQVLENDHLSIVAHDLRLPLSNVMGYAAILSDGTHGPLTDAQRVDILRIQSNATTMMHLIEGLLVALRGADATRPPPQLEVDLAAYLTAALERNAHLARSRRVRYRTEFPAGGGRAKIAVRAIDQVINNLLGNAVKFSPAGGEVTVGFARTVDEVRLWVHDTGRGIPADELNVLFGRFSQATAQPTACDLGFGLGLYIVDSIARQQGGRMQVASAPGDGTTMTLVLPDPAGAA